MLDAPTAAQVIAAPIRPLLGHLRRTRAVVSLRIVRPPAGAAKPCVAGDRVHQGTFGGSAGTIGGGNGEGMPSVGRSMTFW